MRTTIDLPEPLHRLAQSLARHSGRSLSAVISELAQRGLRAGAAEPVAEYRLHPGTGLPVVRSNRPISADDVAAADEP
ncbi:MAG: hypothetical protein AB7V26_12775 [Lysobacterales bacterium]